MTEHRPERPSWTCAFDHKPWPCVPARTALVEAFAANTDALPRHMAHLMIAATADLKVSDPAGLYRRFVAWTLPDKPVCQRCGKTGHTVLPGMPPRLAPCSLTFRAARCD